MVASTPQPVRIEGTRVDARNVAFGPFLVMDEVHMEVDDILITPPVSLGEAPHVACGDARVSALISEQNLNRALELGLQPDGALKDIRVAMMSGRVRLSFQLAKLVSLSVSVEATPRIENGIRVVLDWQAATVAGIAVPHGIVTALQDRINKALDLSKSPVPVWIDEVRCEPGRLTVLGKVQLAWPLPAQPTSPGPFSALDLLADVEPKPAPAKDAPPGS
jgi:hypothetical protein